jgi:hypothetical protein
MKFNSYEIDDILFNRQLSLYQRIDDLIKKHFNELDSDRLAVLSRTLLELEERMQLYKKGLQHSELFGVTYRNNRKERKLEGSSLMEILSTI